MKYLLLLAIAALAAPAAESPFACNRAALTPQARKRHFDLLGPASPQEAHSRAARWF
jgi:hypothetical protein